MTTPMPYCWKRLSPKRRERLDRCIVAYLRRLYRQEEPAGSFKEYVRDGLPPWFPSDEERFHCCYRVRTPSRAYPLSLNTHCRSIEHLANLYDVDLGFLHRQLRLIRLNRIPKKINLDYIKGCYVSGEQLDRQADGYTDRMYGVNSHMRNRYYLDCIERYFGYLHEDQSAITSNIEGRISEEQLKQQANDYANRMCDINPRDERNLHYLDYVAQYLRYPHKDRLAITPNIGSRISEEQLERQADKYAVSMCFVKPDERNRNYLSLIKLYRDLHEEDQIEGRISREQLERQAEDYAAYHDYTSTSQGYHLHYLEYIEAFLDYIAGGSPTTSPNSNIRLFPNLTVLDVIEHDIIYNRTIEPPAPGRGRLPFDPEVNVKDEDTDDFLSELDKLIKSSASC